jgi:hypothetical protein
LSQAKWQTVLHAVAHIRSALDKLPAAWSVEEARAVAIAAPQLGLLDYLQDWHKWEPGEQATMVQAARAFLDHGDISGGQRLDRRVLLEVTEEWRKLAQGDVPLRVHHGLDSERLPKPSRARQPAQPPTPQPPAQPSSMRRQPAGASDKPRRAHLWQTFDEVFHPQYGRGIVISTTTTTRGRELKVQFVDGNLKHFRDDDPALARG